MSEASERLYLRRLQRKKKEAGYPWRRGTCGERSFKKLDVAASVYQVWTCQGTSTQLDLRAATISGTVATEKHFPKVMKNSF